MKTVLLKNKFLKNIKSIPHTNRVQFCFQTNDHIIDIFCIIYKNLYHLIIFLFICPFPTLLLLTISSTFQAAFHFHIPSFSRLNQIVSEIMQGSAGLIFSLLRNLKIFDGFEYESRQHSGFQAFKRVFLSVFHFNFTIFSADCSV